MVDEEVKSLAVAFMYNQIKGIVDGMIGNMGVAIDTDLILLAFGYYKRHTWWGKGLLYGAVSAIGAKGGLAIGGLLGGGKPQAQANVPPAVYKAMNKYGYIRWARVR